MGNNIINKIGSFIEKETLLSISKNEIKKKNIMQKKMGSL